MSEELQKIGRLAFREEGSRVVAYYAKPGTMKDAIKLFEVLTVSARLPGVKEHMFNLGQAIVGEVIFERFGIRPTWGGPVTAPEHERAGNA